MGTIYEAVQEHPRRAVAVKLMKAGVASPTALRRFEFESQLLARLRHPGIAEVYEAGTHDDGSGPVPYFAMEYIANASPITAFADAKGLDVRARLHLFADVCDAVHHGHQKGIIHRDLKPDNVIVASDGRPKIIDFGVARATDSDLALATLQTEYGQLVGTLQYMSPEQVSADPHDIDIRSDVYSLGVILYELLCGRVPYDLRVAAALDAARRVRDETPPRLGALDRKLAGDLETVVHKALEKDRERRYQSAGELAADLRRYLNKEPIAARPPALFYQVKVFARRNKILVGSVAAVFLVLVLAVVTSTALYVRAEADRAEARRQAGRALAAIKFTNEVVSSTDPKRVGDKVRIAELLKRYEKHAGEAFPDDPEIEAAIRISIGRSYDLLALFEKGAQAEEYRRAAQSNLESAVRLRRRALEAQRRAFGEDHPKTLDGLAALADLLKGQEAEGILREIWAIRRRTLGERHSETLAALQQVANSLFDQGRSGEAEALTRKVLDDRRRVLGESDEGTLQSMLTLAHLLRSRAEFAEAEDLGKKVLARCAVTGEDADANREIAIRELASTYLTQEKVVEAQRLYSDWRVPPTLDVERWIQGGTNPRSDRPTVVIIWELWCPFSRVALPKLQQTFAAYGARGLGMVGLTSLSGNTEEEVRAFIREEAITFPNAVGSKAIYGDFHATGIPIAVLLRENRVVWQGHPDGLAPAILDGLVAQR